MKKLFLQSGKLMVGEFPEEPNEKHFSGDQWKEKNARVQYQATVSAAKASAVEVVDMAHGFYKALLNSQNIATGEGSEQEVLFALNSLQEGQLYDTPEGWTVHIGNGCPKCGALVLEECNGDYNTCDEYPNRQIARLIPLKEQSSGTVATGIPESGEKQTKLDLDEREELVKHHQSRIDYYRSRIAVLRGESVSPPPQAESQDSLFELIAIKIHNMNMEKKSLQDICDLLCDRFTITRKP